MSFDIVYAGVRAANFLVPAPELCSSTIHSHIIDIRFLVLAHSQVNEETPGDRGGELDWG